MSGSFGSGNITISVPPVRGAVLTQGREVSPHIVRMNFIVAEMFADEDDQVCEHCGSMNVINLKTVTPEYDDNKQPAYYEINTFGTSAAYDKSWRRRRDMIEERQCCNFCGHTISLGFTWTDWYKVQDFALGDAGLVLLPNSHTTIDSSDPQWNPNDTLGYSNWTVTCSNNSYPQKNEHISMGCSSKGNWNGTGYGWR